MNERWQVEKVLLPIKSNKISDVDSTLQLFARQISLLYIENNLKQSFYDILHDNYIVLKIVTRIAAKAEEKNHETTFRHWMRGRVEWVFNLAVANAIPSNVSNDI